MPLRWKKRLGQHLLHDRNILRKIVAALRLSGNQHVIEIGCGSGALTEFLVKEPAIVTSVEIDPQFFEGIEQKFGDLDNFTLVKGDILSLNLHDLAPVSERTVITGNLPYNITSQILFHLFSQRNTISRMVFTAQKEVAERMVAAPGIKDRGILSVLCQLYSFPKILFSVSRNSFYPKPRVDSVVVEFELKPVPRDVDTEQLMRLVKTCFGKRRKTLRNSLGDYADVSMHNADFPVDLNRRPEELDIDEFLEIAKALDTGTSFTETSP